MRSIRGMRKSCLILFIIGTIIAAFVYYWGLREKNESSQSVNQDTFDNIYNTLYWGGGGDGSGPGSEPGATIPTVEAINNIVVKYNVSSIVDAACGACKWTHALIAKLQEHGRRITYAGVDVSSVAASRCKQNLEVKYPDAVTVFHGDMTTFKFPAADMLMCRDALQHMSYDMIRSALKNFASSDIRIFAAGSYVENYENANINTGDYFSINLTKPPFNFVDPKDIIKEAHDKYILVYTIEQLRDFTKSNPFFT